MRVFRKRALDGGGRLLHESPSHPNGTLLLNVWAEVLVLTICAAGDFLHRATKSSDPRGQSFDLTVSKLAGHRERLRAARRVLCSAGRGSLSDWNGLR
ncbi:MAG: hypothetical protein KDB50_01315 [Mycobacterium sp.]|nr:hypothetical protein [Mycobacterium sp.]